MRKPHIVPGRATAPSAPSKASGSKAAGKPPHMAKAPSKTGPNSLNSPGRIAFA